VAAAAAGEEAGVSGDVAMRDRPWWLGVLLRGPGELRSVPWRVVITLVIVAGAACVILSGVIHLYLWEKQYGYRDVPTIGPLFLAQGIAAILIGLVVLITRRVAAVIVGAGLMVASVVALVLAVEVGLFGFKDSWLAPYATVSLYEEIAGAVLLLSAAVVLCWSSLGAAWSSRSGSTAASGTGL
jgi:hypothetical protein